jgi:hypothetical protein
VQLSCHARINNEANERILFYEITLAQSGILKNAAISFIRLHLTSAISPKLQKNIPFLFVSFPLWYFHFRSA